LFNKSIDINSYDYVFVELPAIVDNPYPLSLFEEADNSLLIVRANRAWSEADANALMDVQKITKKKASVVILNGVELNEMESILGDLPKKRSWFRKGIKNILRLRFFTNSKEL
jgi:hypothetical protein